ncbi:biotin carboxylase [Advenella sp. S44]|uniref:acetyl-CoA carboxylase biotin carboxylase subunit n=1 Tax=Advenella sp. S44 TaxID=1982755 RepID=UPI000C2A44F0|nr:biotin carboxylase N-terminal domain-containing protein [Advenella sp. S44]PJX22078.1 biotin carboxylase [Advenella sp. S44]
MFQKVLVSNRAAIAARVLRTLRKMGIRSVAIYSEADASLPYLALADETYCIGPADPAHSYMNQDAILKVLEQSGADAVHPGYGFLSENAAFARKVMQAGVTFIGPSPQWIDAMGHKTRARALMHEFGLAMAASSGLLTDDENEQRTAAAKIGYPVMVKAAAGGGGIGMAAVHNDAQLLKAVVQTKAMALRSFGSADLYLERMMERPRHIEFQILADRYGNACHLFERDCSVQRRHQKVIEESPAARIPRALINAKASEIVQVLQNMKYDVIGTVETLLDQQENFQFLETNTRIQVEHAVTEEITGVDLVQVQIRLAAGERLSEVLPESVSIRGHAIEARIYAEDPVRFFPSPGTLRALSFPAGRGIRVETGFAAGNVITPYYDPMIAKLIVHADSREKAICKLQEALTATVIEGVKNNIPFIQKVIGSAQFKAGDVDTGLTQRILSN